MGAISEATEGFAELEALKASALEAARRMDVCDDDRVYASLMRQHRENLRRINEIEGGADADDEIAAIIVRNRKSGAD